jgi:hypothetical protein
MTTLTHDSIRYRDSHQVVSSRTTYSPSPSRMRERDGLVVGSREDPLYLVEAHTAPRDSQSSEQEGVR